MNFRQADVFVDVMEHMSSPPKLGEKRKFWFVSGASVYQEELIYCAERKAYSGVEPEGWYRFGFGVEDDHDYTVGIDMYETHLEAVQLAKKNAIEELNIKQKALDKLKEQLGKLCVLEFKMLNPNNPGGIA